MTTLGLGKGLILTPVTSSGIYYEVPDELAGIASSITNTMHKIDGCYRIIIDCCNNN